jgi:hypothetical protein
LLDTPPEPAFDRLTRLAATALGVPIAPISLIDEERQWFKSRFGLSIGEISRDDSFCAHRIVADHMLVVGNATQDQRFLRQSFWSSAIRTSRIYAGVLLQTADGLALGTPCTMARSSAPTYRSSRPRCSATSPPSP